MPCAGCARRRKKIAAAYHAVKYGAKVVKESYIRQTTGLPSGFKPRERPKHFKREVIDIRNTADS